LSANDADKAGEAFRLRKIMNHPSIKNSIDMIGKYTNQKHDSEALTSKSFVDSVKVYGDVNSLDGKNKERKASSTYNDMDLYKNLTSVSQIAHMDIVEISGQKFLSSVLSPLHHRKIFKLKNKTSGSIIEGLRWFLSFYKQRNIKVKDIKVDNDPTFVAPETAVIMKNEFNANTIAVATNEHVVKAEVNHKVIQERVRAKVSELKDDGLYLPATTLKFLVERTTIFLNMEPVSSAVRVDPTPSHVAILGRLINKEIELKFNFFDFVLCKSVQSEFEKKGLVTRNERCLYLFPNESGNSHRVLDMFTWTVKTRKHCIHQPMDDTIKLSINERAKREQEILSSKPIRSKNDWINMIHPQEPSASTVDNSAIITDDTPVNDTLAAPAASTAVPVLGGDISSPPDPTNRNISSS
jgi:hypothetical protein